MTYAWKAVESKYTDIKHERFEGIAKITINRPEVRNAFRPQTLFEMSAAFEDAREDAFASCRAQATRRTSRRRASSRR